MLQLAKMYYVQLANVQYPSDTRYKVFCVSNAFKRGAKRVYYKCKTHVNAEQNACKRGAKRKRKTRLLAMPNAFAGNAFCETRLN